MAEQIVSVEAEQMVKETETMVKSYENYTVVSQETYGDAGDILKAIKAKSKSLNELRKTLTKPLDESKKLIMAFFNKPLGFLTQAEKDIKSAMITWQQEQEAIRLAEEKRLADIQRKEADELQRKANIEMERINKLKTAKAKEAAQAKALELQAKADAVTSCAPTKVANKVEAVAGISTRKVWKFKVVDANLIPREYMMPDEKFIGKMIEASKGSKPIAGIEIYSEDIIVARR